VLIAKEGSMIMHLTQMAVKGTILTWHKKKKAAPESATGFCSFS